MWKKIASFAFGACLLVGCADLSPAETASTNETAAPVESGSAPESTVPSPESTKPITISAEKISEMSLHPDGCVLICGPHACGIACR
jgi:hypothetical protein